jgi:peptidoglycan/xylan/chitin deacetylase (PgdA/CDA1 family)
MELAADGAVAGGAAMDATMTGPGVVVIAGTSPRTARTLDALARLSPPRAMEVVVVMPSATDPRAAAWIEAVAGTRKWRLVATASDAPGARLNDGFRACTSDWLFALDAGEVLLSGSAAAVVPGAADAPLVAGGVHVVALGVDERAAVQDVSSPATLDPAHPVLRGICWRRRAVEAAGGFDDRLAGAVRYELWLRLLAAGRAGVVTPALLVRTSVADGEPLPAELGSPAFLAAARDVRSRYAPLLRACALDVLEARAARVADLGAKHQRALVRHGAPAAAPTPAPAGAASADQIARRTSPLSLDWGYDRGGPLDRAYIEAFIERHAGDIRGVVLEVQEPGYTSRFGGEAVTRSDVVDLDETNTAATIVADLRAAAHLPPDTYDCIILTQTVHVIPQMGEVIAECHRLLRPGGVLLATMPSVSRVCLEYGRDGDFWRVTPAGARHLAASAFGEAVEVTAFGNVLASSAFLYGLGRGEVDPGVLAETDAYNPTLVGVRAVKAAPDQAGAPAVRVESGDRGLVLLYHRVGGTDPDPHGLSVDVPGFEAQVAWLARACAVLPLTELVDRARRRRLPARAVAITIDDGYADTLRVAAPRLAAHRLPATCFVATEGLDAAHVYWWDRVAAALLGPGERPPSLAIVLPDRRWTLATGTAGERLLAHGLIHGALVGASGDVRRAVVDALETWSHGAAPSADCRRMTAEEIRALSAAGVAIGAHTVHHPLLPREAPEVQAREILESVAVLERLTGAPVVAFAYPHGAFDETSAAAVRDAGLRCAFTCEARAISATDDAWRLPRLDPRARSLDRFTAVVAAHLGAGGS